MRRRKGKTIRCKPKFSFIFFFVHFLLPFFLFSSFFSVYLSLKPYTDGPGGNGQYTKKIYHVGSHLPGWLRNILPKNALIVYEEAWNAYPCTPLPLFCCDF